MDKESFEARLKERAKKKKPELWREFTKEIDDVCRKYAGLLRDESLIELPQIGIVRSIDFTMFSLFASISTRNYLRLVDAKNRQASVFEFVRIMRSAFNNAIANEEEFEKHITDFIKEKFIEGKLHGSLEEEEKKFKEKVARMNRFLDEPEDKNES